MSVIEGKFERTSTVAASRGLHVLRYVSSSGDADGPIAAVRPAAGSEALVELISPPGEAAGQLKGPGAFLIVRADRDAALEIGVRPRFPGGPLEASLRMEALILSDSGVAAPSEAAPAASATKPQLALGAGTLAPEPSGVSVLAHVAMRGDVEVAESEWAAGPDSPSPIEGLEIRARTPGRLHVEMQVAVVGAGRWSEWVGAGAFAGTRGRGLPLAGVRLRLAGTAADSMEITADALFLGSLILSKRGREVELTSSTGADPLVGFRLAVGLAERPAPLTPRRSDGASAARGCECSVLRRVFEKTKLATSDQS